MASISIVVRAGSGVGRDARLVAAEVAWALSCLGLKVTLGNGIDWPAMDGNGDDKVVARHRDLADVIEKGHEFSVGVVR
jgi:hypothetical protein